MFSLLVRPQLPFPSFFLTLCLICTIKSESENENEAIGLKTCGPGFRIYGPGWEQPQLILPSRYFFIQVTDRCAKEAFDVHITSPRGDKDCRYRLQVLRQTLLDFVIVRYRLLSPSCRSGLTISVSHKESGELLARKETHTGIQSEECICRLPDFSERMGCPADINLSRIHQDLRYVIALLGCFVCTTLKLFSYASKVRS